MSESGLSLKYSNLNLSYFLNKSVFFKSFFLDPFNFRVEEKISSCDQQSQDVEGLGHPMFCQVP